MKKHSEENSQKSRINWFPGHMARAKNEITESLKLVDLTAEILDARIPISSRNSDLDSICKSKPKIVVLNKADLIEKSALDSWVTFYEKKGIVCVPFSNKISKTKQVFIKKVRSLMKEKIDSWESKGIIGRKIRLMIVGIPNVGKSSFINSFAKSSKLKVENRPGVTRKNQWVCVNEGLEFLDTPGVLMPKIESEKSGYNLALTGAIKDEILDIEELAVFFVENSRNSYQKNICERYKLKSEDFENLSSLEILNLIGKKRGMLVSGGEIDLLRASDMIIDEFRSGKIGKIILEEPDDYEILEGNRK